MFGNPMESGSIEGFLAEFSSYFCFSSRFGINLSLLLLHARTQTKTIKIVHTRIDHAILLSWTYKKFNALFG